MPAPRAAGSKSDSNFDSDSRASLAAPAGGATSLRGGAAPVDGAPGAGGVAPASPPNPPLAPVTPDTPDTPDALNALNAELVDAAGIPRPQTADRPSVDSAAFHRRISALARAIESGDAEGAKVAFFPVLAYQQVKAVAKPERDYRFRLLANFERDIREYHRVLGRDAANAKFEGIVVSERDARWMPPGSEGNKLGYFRVLRSHLRFTLPAGRSRELELTSLISWRGEWYVVHLHGFE